MFYEDFDFDRNGSEADKAEHVVMEEVNDGEEAAYNINDAGGSRSLKRTSNTARKKTGNKRKVTNKAPTKRKEKAR